MSYRRSSRYCSPVRNSIKVRPKNCEMILKRLYFLPLILFVIFPATFLGTYTIAVLLGHVEAEFPYISDTATYSPESCVFGQLMNAATVLLIFMVYVRHRQVIEFHQSYGLSEGVMQQNKVAKWLGYIACFGLSLVANFQETSVIVVHLTGAFLCFGVGTVYMWIQAICSYYLHPMANSIYMAHVRVALSMISTTFYVLLIVTGIMSRLQFHGTNPRKWYPEDGGWELHIASTASEWIVAVAFCFFLLSFVPEFKSITMEEPKVFLTVERRSNVDEETTPVITQSSTAEEVDVIVRQEGSNIVT